MTTIKTTCTRCGDVQLSPEDLELELDPSEEMGSYRFACPTCAFVQRRPANARVVSVLLATGVDYAIINTNPITESEIDSFVSALETELEPVRLIAS